MRDHYADIYAHHADEYEQLISRENYTGNLLATLQKITPLEGLDVIDMGAGTGRLVRILAPFARAVRAFDASAAMLAVAAARLKASGAHNWQVAVADHRALPAQSRSADLVISGWSICYTVVWEEDWQTELDKALSEMERVARPGGTLVILETLGTGFETPTPPQTMQKYFAHLDTTGFSSTWIRTDYRFASIEEARELTTFFFQADMTDQLISREPAILPECTGIWYKQGKNSLADLVRE
ncbi:MAG TPA: class I SAM-dependent methyltransferase [Anaerolineae bacterium]|nr:class I SAM-dependent methyltransferase [Anaerolineae bacterium]HQI83625.1 class I SAM-dependent methyltransferase [Anaerolineae bacterium]